MKLNEHGAVRGSGTATCFALAILLAGCGPVNGPYRAPDTVLVGGTVWTGVRDASFAGGVAITDGGITAVGGSEEVRNLAAPGTTVIELDGRFAMPGFIDTHTHFVEGGFQLARVDLRDAATPEEFIRRLAAVADTLPEGLWIQGGDWDHELWGGELPDRSWIDSVTPRHPVMVRRLDWHMMLANTRAMDVAGVTDDAKSPPGGVVVRDAAGRMTGVFRDDAMDLVGRAVPDPSERELDAALRASMAHAASLGVTGVHGMGLGDWSHLETYRRAHAAGDLTLRVYAFTALSSWERIAGEVNTAGGNGDAWLRIGGVKGFVDGSLGSSTALFKQPFEGEPDNRGIFVTEEADLRSWIGSADGAGLHIAIHAIGDRANSVLLDLYEAIERTNGTRDRRLRIEHAQHLSPEDVRRIGRMGVIPAAQPYHAADDGRWAARRVGETRTADMYAFRSLLDAGARVAFGSDWTVAPLDPWLGVHAAVTRQTIDGRNPDGWHPEQRVDLEQALVAYTRDAAFAGFQEDVVGTLEVGKRADIVVTDRNPFEIAPEDLARVRTEMTFVDGREVYRRP